MDTPVPCDIMLVAESPTYIDDSMGVPFAGKGLGAIRSLFLKRDLQVHCAYGVKCAKPAKDTNITAKIIKTCVSEYLAKEIQIVKPKHIVVFGKNALHSVLGKAGGFSELQGTKIFNEALQAWIYPTLHQAQAAYNEDQKAVLLGDLRRFISWIKDEEVIEFSPPVYVADTLKSLRILQHKIREAGGIVAVDTETQGLNQYAPGKSVRCIQFCWDEDFGGVFVPLGLEDECFYTNTRQIHDFWKGSETLTDAIEIIREILLEAQCIWHNGKFDRIWLAEWGTREFGAPILAPNIYMDTIQVAHALNENRALGLKKLITQELGVPTYEIPDKLTLDLDLLIPYGTKDTVASLILAKKYTTILEGETFEKLAAFYEKGIKAADRTFTNIELLGWPVDQASLEKLQAVVEAEIEELETEMHTILVSKGIKVPSTAFASPTKLAKILFDADQLGYLPNPNRQIALTKEGKLSTSEDALLHLSHNSFVSKLLDWRERAKLTSTYLEPMLKMAKARGRITTSYKLTGTVTGRTASGKEKSGSARQIKTASGMNLQNLPYAEYGPEKLKLRNCIRARDGWSIAEFDFSQIELRIAGWMSKDRFFLEAYAQGKDIHALTAMMVNGLTQEEWDALPKSEKKSLRQRAKAVNFGFLYGMGAKTFQRYALTDYGVEFTFEECHAIRRKFFEEHSGLPPWYERQERQAQRLGYVESPSGRRRHLPNIKLDPDSGKDARQKYQEALRYAINTPVQGFASDLKLMSLVQVASMLPPDEALTFGEIHDSILVEIRNDRLEFWVPKIIQIMRHPALLDELEIDLTVPVEAEVKVGPSLGEAKDYEL